MRINCAHCNKQIDKSTGAINRAGKIKAKLFCGKVCFGLSRRVTKDLQQKKIEKREYDRLYRAKNFESRKILKAEYFKRTYDPVKAAIERKKNMQRHVEYCRRPEYRAKKKDYDHVYNAKRDYGEYWEQQLLILAIEKEALSRQSRYEIMLERGMLNKSQQRKRTYEKLNSAELEAIPMGNLIRA